MELVTEKAAHAFSKLSYLCRSVRPKFMAVLGKYIGDTMDTSHGHKCDGRAWSLPTLGI